MDKLLDPISLYIVGGLLVVLLVVLLLRSNRTSRKAAPAWAIGLAAGLAVGCGASLLAIHRFGYHWNSQFDADGGDPDAPPSGAGGPGGMGVPGGMGMGGMGMGGMGMGGMGMGGGLGGEANAAGRSRRQLTTLVGKLDLLTAGLPFELSSDQTEKLTSALAKLDSAEELSDDEADEQLEAINAIFTDEQKKTLEAISLPRPAGGGPGGGFGGGPPGGGAPGGGNTGRRPPLEGGAGGPAASGQGGGAAIAANPFREGDNQEKLRALLGRLESDGDESPAPEAQDPETEADKTKAEDKDADGNADQIN